MKRGDVAANTNALSATGRFAALASLGSDDAADAGFVRSSNAGAGASGNNAGKKKKKKKKKKGSGGNGGGGGEQSANKAALSDKRVSRNIRRVGRKGHFYRFAHFGSV